MNDQYCFYCCLEKGRPGGCELCGAEADGREVDSHPLYLAPGTILEDKYLIGRVLGHGGFGITYLGLDLNLQMRVAIKEHLPRELATRHQDGSTVVPYSGQATESFIYGMNKFIEEGRTLARFADHPNIVSVVNFFEANNTAYLVMLYLEGNNLLEFLKLRGGRIPESEAIPMMTMVLDGLRSVHGENLLHRDIKPANIFLTKEGSIRLVDFGSARRAMGEHSATMSKIVSEGYSPFEQYTQGIKEGPWTDIYAVSATFYRLLSGRRPQPASERIAEDNLQLLTELVGDDVSQSLSDAVARGLSIRPEDRYQSVEEMLSALSGAKSVELSPVKEFINRNVSENAVDARHAGGAREIDFEENALEHLSAGDKPFGAEPEKLLGVESFPGFEKYAISECEVREPGPGAVEDTQGRSSWRRITIADVDQYAMSRLPRHLLERYKVIPMASNENWMKLAMADPANIVALDDIKFISGVSKVEVVPAVEESVISTLRHYYRYAKTDDGQKKKDTPEVMRIGNAKEKKIQSPFAAFLKRWRNHIIVATLIVAVICAVGSVIKWLVESGQPENLKWRIQPKSKSHTVAKPKPTSKKIIFEHKIRTKSYAKSLVEKVARHKFSAFDGQFAYNRVNSKAYVADNYEGRSGTYVEISSAVKFSQNLFTGSKLTTTIQKWELVFKWQNGEWIYAGEGPLASKSTGKIYSYTLESSQKP